MLLPLSVKLGKLAIFVRVSKLLHKQCFVGNRMRRSESAGVCGPASFVIFRGAGFKKLYFRSLY